MLNIQCGYSQPNFRSRRLVPISEYSGTPRLSKSCIKLIERTRKLIAEADGNAIQTQNNLDDSAVSGRLAAFLREKLKLINKFRESLESQIEYIRAYNKPLDYKDPVTTQKQFESALADLEHQYSVTA